MADDEPPAASDEAGPEEPSEPVVPVIDHRSQRIGLGMLASLGVGFSPLRDAVTGSGSFEGAIGRYLLCLGASVGAALVLGHLLDGAPPVEAADEQTDTTGRSPGGR